MIHGYVTAYGTDMCENVQYGDMQKFRGFYGLWPSQPRLILTRFTHNVERKFNSVKFKKHFCVFMVYLRRFIMNLSLKRI